MARVLAVAVGACLVGGSAFVLAGCGGKGTAGAAATTTVKRHVQQLPRNAVRIHWKRAALVPAPRAGRVCVVTYKTGHFCARYAFGEIPATVLRRKLRSRGWVVVESS